MSRNKRELAVAAGSSNASTVSETAKRAVRKRASVLEAFRYSLLTILVFPLGAWGTYHGGLIALSTVAFVMALHVLLDTCAPKLGKAEERFRAAHDFWLIMHLPTALVLVAIVVLRSASGAIELPPALDMPRYGSGFALLGAIVSCSFMYGGNTVVAHEMMHRNAAWARVYAWVLLTVTGDGQFNVAHVHCHHRNVATLDDPATARRGESLYPFLLRSTIGQYREALDTERRRLARRGEHRFWHNRVWLTVAGTLALCALIGYGFGLVSALSYFGVIVGAKILLEAINYVQHFGLVRAPGKRVEDRHSWDCGGMGVGLMLFGLNFHSQHHANPKIAMWNLEMGKRCPQLEHGYMFSLALSFFPGPWFRYVKPRLAKWDVEFASEEERRLIQARGW